MITYLAIPAAETVLSEIIPWFAHLTMVDVRNDMPFLKNTENSVRMRTWATSSEHLSVALQTTSLQTYCGSLPEDMASSILPCSGSRASRIAQQEYARNAVVN